MSKIDPSFLPSIPNGKTRFAPRRLVGMIVVGPGDSTAIVGNGEGTLSEDDTILSTILFCNKNRFRTYVPGSDSFFGLTAVG